LADPMFLLNAGQDDAFATKKCWADRIQRYQRYGAAIKAKKPV
jgi:hypothetical protein